MLEELFFQLVQNHTVPNPDAKWQHYEFSSYNIDNEKVIVVGVIISSSTQKIQKYVIEKNAILSRFKKVNANPCLDF